MTTARKDPDMTTATTQTPWDYMTKVHDALLDAGLGSEKAGGTAKIAFRALSDYILARKDLRTVYVRIAATAQRAIEHINDGYSIYSNDELGSDKERLVALHTTCQLAEQQVKTTNYLIEQLAGVDIDPFDYLGSED
jgi:hypothetical protein